jgi:copper chaperone NosL
MTTRVLLILGLAMSVACGVGADGPPEIEVDRDACSHCGMLISEPAYAAAYRASGSNPRVFDDIGCLLEAARREPHADALRFWFQDAASPQDGPRAARGRARGEKSPQDGPRAAGGRPRGEKWIDGRDAVFVSSPALRTPMGGGLIAYRDRTAAREGAALARGRVVDSLSDLLNSKDLGGHRASGQAR